MRPRVMQVKLVPETKEAQPSEPVDTPAKNSPETIVIEVVKQGAVAVFGGLIAYKVVSTCCLIATDIAFAKTSVSR